MPALAKEDTPRHVSPTPPASAIVPNLSDASRRIAEGVRSVVPAGSIDSLVCRKWLSAAGVVLLCCFILPFASVSCAGEKVNVTGAELASGRTFSGEKLEIVKLALLAAGLALAAMLACLSAKNTPSTGVLASMCAGGCLLSLWALPKELNKLASSGIGSVNIEWGYYMAMACSLAVVVLGLLAQVEPPKTLSQRE